MRVSPFAALLCVFLSFCSSGSCGRSHGAVYLRFIFFHNPKGLGNNGHICEGKNFFKLFTRDECDHYFDVTLQSFEGRHLARKETPATENQRKIHFGGHVGGMRNPLAFRVNQMQHFHIKIRVMDEDKNSNDFVGDFVTSIVSLPVGMNGQPAAKRIDQSLRADRGLQIKFQVWGQCDRSYYGSNCDVKCVPQDSTWGGHYTCDAKTGKKVCKKGFTSDSCLRQDFCASSPCRNNAGCVNSVNSFVCRCTQGFEGLHCEKPINPCDNSPCQNGASCTEISGSPRCECRRGFVGRLCERDLDECFQAAPCLNNGSCHNTPGSFSCSCTGGFTGPRCERPPQLPKASEMASHVGSIEREAQQVARMAQAKENPVGDSSKGLLWPYLVAVAAVLVAVVCLALMVTVYRRRRFIVIKERNGETVAYSANPQPPPGPTENVYISDEGSDSTFYEDIDRHLSEGRDEDYSDIEHAADFANASYGGFTSSREEV